VKTRRLVASFEQLFNAISGGASALVRQLTIADFRPISRYEYIIPRLSKCYVFYQNIRNTRL